jgi:hypothetical protein
MGEVDARPGARRAGSRAAKASAAAAEAAAGSRPVPGAHIGRQAVVVVHGQGQQRPMGTIRDFVDALWRHNPDLGALPAAKRLPGQTGKDREDEGRDVWIVPDFKSGLFELQRITTPEFPDPQKTGRPGRRTDFFELYYADLLSDTPIRNLWLWTQRLLSIDPKDVTDRMRFPWRIFLLLATTIGALAVVAILHIPHLLRADWVGPILEPRAFAPTMVILACLLALLLPKLNSLFAVIGRIPRFVIVGVILVAILLIYPDWVLLAVVFLALFAYLVASVLLPLFGDAASYLSAETETVRSRQAVRERGLKLLRHLHDDKDYQRVIVIAHSLGTALAYDLLHILWQEVGPTKDNPPGADALEMVRKVDSHTAEVEARLRDDPGPKWTEADVRIHQDLQWAAFDLLRQQPAVTGDRPDQAKPAGWKISDFVTLGSPLTNAQFLVASGALDFGRLKAERVLPTAPPQPYEHGEQAVHTEKDGTAAMHHAAVFSTVRWTNIHDPFHKQLLVFGDIISGPVGGRSRFGDAVRDVEVRIERPLPWPFNRFFTHGHYWIEARKDRGVSEHVRMFRDAVGLYRGMELPRT